VAVSVYHEKTLNIFSANQLLLYSIEAAIASGCFDRIIVSTDDKEIAGISRQYGAEVPFLRPCNISDDEAGINSVMAHAVKWLISNDQDPDFVCCIFATAPLLYKPRFN